MIYCDHEIAKLIETGKLIVEPQPLPDQYDSSALNLRVGDDFRVWKKSLKVKEIKHIVDLDHIDLADFIDLTDELERNAQGMVAIAPGEFVLARTLEYVTLPTTSKLAARVEGRSKMARLGMTAHITAPTIHSGFSGKITLEIINHGPFTLAVRPNSTRLCQLIVEAVKGVPNKGGSIAFTAQTTPLGTPKKSH